MRLRVLGGSTRVVVPRVVGRVDCRVRPRLGVVGRVLGCVRLTLGRCVVRVRLLTDWLESGRVSIFPRLVEGRVARVSLRAGVLRLLLVAVLRVRPSRLDVAALEVGREGRCIVRSRCELGVPRVLVRLGARVAPRGEVMACRWSPEVALVRRDGLEAMSPLEDDLVELRLASEATLPPPEPPRRVGS